MASPGHLVMGAAGFDLRGDPRVIFRAFPEYAAFQIMNFPGLNPLSLSKNRSLLPESL